MKASITSVLSLPTMTTTSTATTNNNGNNKDDNVNCRAACLNYTIKLNLNREEVGEGARWRQSQKEDLTVCGSLRDSQLSFIHTN